MLVLSCLVAFLTTAVSFRHWRDAPRSGPASWSLVSFSILTAVLLELVITQSFGIEVGAWVTKLLLAVLVFFPYSLFKFSRSFQTVPDWRDQAALVVTAALSVGAFFLPGLDGESDGGAMAGAVRSYLLAVLLQWTVLSSMAALQLWRSGSGLATVARRRMKLMGGATMALNGAILVVLIPEEAQIDAPAQILVFVTSLLFLLGLAPPPFLRQFWRQSDQAALQRTIEALMGAVTSEEVGSVLLRDAVGLVGAESAALIDADGNVLARSMSEDLERTSTGGVSPAPERINLGPQGFVLEVRFGPYAPYFGAEEAALLRTVGALAKLSLERNALFEEQARVVEDLRSEIHERVRVEKELQEARLDAEGANLAKSEFLSRMSHELRTPLNSILGFAQLLELDELEAEQRDSTEQILKGGRRLLELINEVLDISRIETGTLQLSLEPVQVGEVIDDAVDLIRPLADVRGIRIRTEGPDEVWARYVFADRQRLGQTVLNLLSNAVKYNVDSGAVTVRAAADHQDTLRFTVTDTGPGISDDKLSHVFTPFERLGAERTSVEGTGLGLALSKSLVEAMGGSLEVDSTEGLGSTFAVELRLASAPDSAVSEPDRRKPRGPQAAGRTILYIEDNPANLRLIDRLVARRDDLELMTALTGTLGIDMATHHTPDLVLLDLHLPDIGGEEVLARLIEDERTTSIPVVILSADATTGQIEKLRAAGAADYLTKPIDVAEFGAVIDRLLS